MQPVDPCAYRDWNEQVLATPHASIFHSANWLRVLQASYGYRPYYFASFKKQQLSTLLPFMEINSWITGIRGVSLPFSDYCEPIIGDDISSQEILKQITIVARQQQWKFFEMRGGDPLWSAATPSTFYDRHVLPLDKDETKVFARLRSNYRARIRKASTNGLSVVVWHSSEAMAEYYRLHCLTRQHQGLPPQPVCFFQHIQEHIIAKNLGFIALVSYKGINIAGAVFFSFGRHAIYKFGAFDRLHQGLFPNYLLFWHVIQWLCRHGYGELCFGRSDSANKGLLQFKAGWGAKKSKLTYYKYSMKKLCFIQENKNSSRSRIWQKLPINLLKIVGSILYKHVG